MGGRAGGGNSSLFPLARRALSVVEEGRRGPRVEAMFLFSSFLSHDGFRGLWLHTLLEDTVMGSLDGVEVRGFSR